MLVPKSCAIAAITNVSRKKSKASSAQPRKQATNVLRWSRSSDFKSRTASMAQSTNCHVKRSRDFSSWRMPKSEVVGAGNRKRSGAMGRDLFFDPPLSEERPYWEEYFDLLSVKDAHLRRNCRNQNGTEPWACRNCDCTQKLEEKLRTHGMSFLNTLRLEKSDF